jgi:hypothetical protein
MGGITYSRPCGASNAGRGRLRSVDGYEIGLSSSGRSSFIVHNPEL